jgi:hypothetical protein
MTPLNLNDVAQFVEENIGIFHERRLSSLQSLKLKQILKRKNPYLFKAKNITEAEQLVNSLLDAHLSSQEEAIFGEFLESLAIFVCNKAYGGRKSSAEGIDLEFEKEGTLYLVSVKSGPNWGNSSQIKRLIDNFNKAQKILHTSVYKAGIVSVNGCCYGRENQPYKHGYVKLCGQAFWELISGDENLYIEIIEPLGHQVKQRNKAFDQAYSGVLHRFTEEFKRDFCTDDEIDWEKLLAYNSAKALPG